MRPYVIPTVLAALLATATATAASADGPRGHALGADLARLAPGADASMPDRSLVEAEAEAPGADAAPCPAEADGTCAAPGAALGR